jgi:branched-chain amino acid transport system permease protein
MIAILGGIGTLWGSVVGAALVVQLEDYLAISGFDGLGIITGAIFVLVVLLFRRGIWGTARDLLARARARRRRTGGDGAPAEAERRPEPAATG